MNLLDSRGTVYYCRAAWLWWMCTVSGRVPAAPWWPHSRRSNWRYFFMPIHPPSNLRLKCYAHPSSIKFEVIFFCPPILHQTLDDYPFPPHPPSNLKWFFSAHPSFLKVNKCHSFLIIKSLYDNSYWFPTWMLCVPDMYHDSVPLSSFGSTTHGLFYC